MEAKELRIGNMYYDADRYIVLEMTIDDIVNIEAKYMRYKRYEPVKLTEEWLVKFGLIKMPESEYTIDTYDFSGFKLWMNDGKFLFHDKIEIKYVHSLQNLFHALTGEELTIK